LTNSITIDKRTDYAYFICIVFYTGTMSKIANLEPYNITPTVEDPEIFDYLAPEIEKLMKES